MFLFLLTLPPVDVPELAALAAAALLSVTPFCLGLLREWDENEDALEDCSEEGTGLFESADESVVTVVVVE
jgi:hypothetical protein